MMARVGFMVMMVALVKSMVDDLLLLMAENILVGYRFCKVTGQIYHEMSVDSTPKEGL